MKDIKDNSKLFKEKNVQEESEKVTSSSATPKQRKPLVVAPMNKRITVRIDSQKKVTEGGIHIPESALGKEAPTHGIVMGIAKDCRPDIKEKIKIGMSIIFSKFAGVDIQPKESTLQDTPYRYQILKEEDVLAVLVEKEKIGDYVHIEETDDSK